MGDFQVSPAPNINFISLIPQPAKFCLEKGKSHTHERERERERATNETLIFERFEDSNSSQEVQ
jgi:hypothetical protein